MAFEHFPYTNLHDLNLDWILRELKKAVGNIDELRKAIENLHVPEYVREALREMAEDGTLEHIINEELFGDLDNKINKVLRHFSPEEERERYKNMIRRNIVSFLYHVSFCTSAQKTQEPSLKVLCKYNNDTGTYMGILGKAEYIPDDMETVNGVAYHVMYNDCTCFVSLITKGRAFDMTPYYYSFTTANPDPDELYKLAQEINDQNQPYTFDCMNSGSARYWAYIMNASGNGTRVLGRTDANSVQIYEEEIAKLETGDIVFTGVSNREDSGNNYDGIAHCTIYVKTLDELNAVAGTYGMTVRPYTGFVDEEHDYLGYVCECTFNATDGHSDAIRITPLWELLNTPLGANRYRIVTACAGVSNALISNKANRLTMAFKRNYHFTDFYDCNFNPTYSQHDIIRARLDNSTGILEVNGLKLGTTALPSKYYNLNDIRETGCWSVSATAAVNQIQNWPPTAQHTYFTLLSFAGRKDQPYGLTQMMIIKTSSSTNVYMRSSNSGRWPSLVWSPWSKITQHADSVDGINIYDLPAGRFYAGQNATIQNKPSDISGAFFIDVDFYGEQKVIRCVPVNTPNAIYQGRYYTDTGVASAWYHVALA